jgi:hypothetical protein
VKKRIVLGVTALVLATFLVLRSVAAASTPTGGNPFDAIWATINSFWDGNTKTLTASKVAYSPSRTHYLVISGPDFVPRDNNLEYLVYPPGVYVTSNRSVSGMEAPVHLPDGAVVTEVRAFFYDNSPYDAFLNLYSFNLIDGYGGAMISTLFSRGNDGYFSVTGYLSPETDFTIDNERHAYTLEAGFEPGGSDLRLVAVRISYTISEAE